MRLCEFSRDKEWLEKLTDPSTSSLGDYKVIDFHIAPRPPAERVQDLVGHLTSAHDGFRVGFHRVDGAGLRARFWDDSQPHWESFDVNSLESDVPPRVVFCAARKGDIDLLAGRPAAFYFFSSPRQGKGILRLLCSHFIWDQFTYAAVANSMNGFWSGKAPVGGGCGYADWMDTYAEYARGPAGVEECRFWTSEPSAAFERFRSLKPLVSDRAAHEATLSASYPLYAILDKFAREDFHCRVSDLVSGAIFVALGRKFGVGDVPVNWTCHGRFPVQGKRFSNAVGFLSNRHPLVVPVGSQDPSAVFRSLQGALNRLPQQGNSYAWIARFSNEAKPSGIPERLYSPITINVRDGFVRPNFSANPPTGVGSFQVTERPLSDWRSGSHMYIVLDVGPGLRVTVTSFDKAGSPTTPAKVASEIGACLQSIVC